MRLVTSHKAADGMKVETKLPVVVQYMEFQFVK